MISTEDLLKSRGSTHGEFRINSAISQALKRTMECSPGWDKLALYKKEGLHMIAHKIGRLLAGDATFQDHYDDIVGYAKLMSERNAEDNKQ